MDLDMIPELVSHFSNCNQPQFMFVMCLIHGLVVGQACMYAYGLVCMYSY
jgi:hypothetical protein